MPFFNRKKTTSPTESPTRPAGLKSLGLKKEKVLECEVAVAGLKFGKGGQGGKYRPFVQISNVTGLVVGRSPILANCITDAHWPILRLSCKLLAPTTLSERSMRTTASAVSSTSFQSEMSANNLADDFAAMTQPLLLAVYDYQPDGKHVLLGKVRTTLQGLVDRAKTLQAPKEATIKELKRKTPSFIMKPNESFGQLFIKQMNFTRGKPDMLSATNFTPQQEHPKANELWPELETVAPPKGMFACVITADSRRRLFPKEISGLSIESDPTGGLHDDSLQPSSDQEEDDEEEDSAEFAAKHLSERRSIAKEESKALIAQARARIEQMKAAQAAKAKRLVEKNAKRANVRFVVEDATERTEDATESMNGSWNSTANDSLSSSIFRDSSPIREMSKASIKLTPEASDAMKLRFASS